MTASSRGATAPRRRHAPDVRRELLLVAARDCIAEHGFARTTARVVATRSGVSLGTLTYHFDSLDTLLMEALRGASAEFTAANLQAATKIEGASAQLRFLIDTALPGSPAADRNWYLWLEYWVRALHEPTMSALHSERYAEWRGAFESILRAGVKSQELIALDPVTTAIELVALLDGLGLQAVIGDPVVEAHGAASLLHAAVDRLVAPKAARRPKAAQPTQRRAKGTQR